MLNRTGGRFIWPSAPGQTVAISSAQLSFLLEGLQEYPHW